MNRKKITKNEVRFKLGVYYTLNYEIDDNLDIEVSINENIKNDVYNKYKGKKYAHLGLLYKDLKTIFKNDYNKIKEQHKLFIKKEYKKEDEIKKDGIIKKIFNDVIGKNIKDKDDFKDDNLKSIWHMEKLKRLEDLKSIINNSQIPINEIKEEYEISEKLFDNNKYYAIDLTEEDKPILEYIVIDNIDLKVINNKIDYNYSFKAFDVDLTDLNEVEFKDYNNYYKHPNIEFYLYKDKYSGYKHIVEYLEFLSAKNILKYKDLVKIANKADRVFK